MQSQNLYFWNYCKTLTVILQINKAASIIYDLLSVRPWKLELEIKGAAAETAINNNNNNGNDYLKTHIY
jgi:hypothetical protein